MATEDEPTPRQPHGLPSLDVIMAVVLFAGSLTAIIVRMVTHVLHISIDDWGYTVWGQAIAAGRRPSLEYLLTAPKPLAYLLGLIATPFRPGYGIAVVIGMFGAGLVAAIAVAVRRQAGFVGVPIALGFLAWTTGFRYNTQRASVDLVSAAMVIVALSVRGRWRIGLLVVAGLVRPEIWPVIALAGYLEARGPRWRRFALGGVAGVIAPALWALTDIAANGRPFMFLVVARDDGTFKGSTTIPNLNGAVSRFYDALSGNIGLLGVALGVAGLIVHTIRSYRSGTLDVFPIAAAAIIAVGVADELAQGLPAYPRYTTSVAALLIVGIGWLAEPIGQRTNGWRAGASATGLSVLMVAIALVFHPVSYPYDRPPHLERAVAAIKQARVCGTISVAGQVHRRNPIISMLSALGRMPLRTFSPIGEQGWRVSGVVLRVKPPAGHPPLTSNPPWVSQAGGHWVRVGTSAGLLWLTEACVQKGGLDPSVQAMPVVDQPAAGPTS
jgi:hypothetical protein